MATIGDSGAPSSNTLYYDALLTTTMAAYRKTLIDNIFKDSAFLSYLRNSGAWTTQNGGERIAIPLMYGDNDTIKTVGGYEALDTTPQEGLTTAFYPWAEIGGTISISRKEERQNAGEGRLLNLLESKLKQAEMTMREKLNTDLLCGTVSSATFVAETSTGGNTGILPLGYFLRKLPNTDPTVTVGNIAAATYAWWRANACDLGGNTTTGHKFQMTVSTYAGLKVGLRRLYNYCARGTGGAPDLLVGDQVSFETYENALDTQVRYTDTKMADLGFDNIKFRGATFIWDESVPDIQSGTAAVTYGTVFMLNTDFYKVVVDSETDIITTPFVEPENQFVKTAKLLFMGNATVSNARKNGVAMTISQSIVS